FLQKTLTALRLNGSRAAALVGDLETDNDARRLALSGVPVRQINTHGICHLEAEMVSRHLESWDGVELVGLDYLFIENVGNLVCPSSYDLGERIRVALLSVTEGEDKPLKYPTLFNSADAAVITKMNIAEAVGFDREAALRNIREIRPGIRVFETSAKTGAGIRVARLSRTAKGHHPRLTTTPLAPGCGENERTSCGSLCPFVPLSLRPSAPPPSVPPPLASHLYPSSHPARRCPATVALLPKNFGSLPLEW